VEYEDSELDKLSEIDTRLTILLRFEIFGNSLLNFENFGGNNQINFENFGKSYQINFEEAEKSIIFARKLTYGY
jgi:hypothetical protein